MTSDVGRRAPGDWPDDASAYTSSAEESFEVEMVDVDRLELHPDNARQGDVGAVAESILKNGFYGAVVAQVRERDAEGQSPGGVPGGVPDDLKARARQGERKARAAGAKSEPSAPLIPDAPVGAGPFPADTRKTPAEPSTIRYRVLIDTHETSEQLRFWWRTDNAEVFIPVCAAHAEDYRRDAEGTLVRALSYILRHYIRRDNPVAAAVEVGYRWLTPEECQQVERVGESFVLDLRDLDDDEREARMPARPPV